MDEIRLINLLASPSQNVKQPGITDSNSTNLPPIITRFPPGSILAGFIINRDAAGNPILRTESGDIAFQTQLFLRIGAEVMIKVESRSGNNVARIITIDGQPPPQNQPVTVTSPEQFASGARPATTAPQASATATVQAPSITVSSSPTLAGTVTSSNTNQLPQGVELAVKVITVALPQAPQTPAAAPTPTPANAAAAAHYAAYKASLTPPQTPPVNIPAPAAQTLQATVTGNTPTGGTIVQTASGVTIQLHTAQPLPAGSNISLQVSPASGAVETPVVLPALASLTQKWPSLNSVLHLLSQELTADQMAKSNVAWLATVSQGSSGPPPSPQAISGGLIAFIFALKGGSFRDWLGRDNVQLLESKGHQLLLKSAEADFMVLARQFIDAPPGQWQSLFFPLAVHGEIQQLRFYLKRERKRDSKQAREEDTRFVIETELSQLGELQLDGFTRKQANTLEFDLYVRTRTPLSQDMQQDIFAIYNNFGELTGYKGQLAFQTVEEFPVRPLQEIIGKDDVGDVIA